MPNVSENLGDSVTKRELALAPGSLPPGIMKEVQSILFLGFDTMIEHGIRVPQRELKRVHNMCKNGN